MLQISKSTQLVSSDVTPQSFSSVVDVDPLTQIFYANRAAYASGDTATIVCNADFIIEMRYNFMETEVILLKDGVPKNSTPIYSFDSYNITTNISFNFTEFDAGVYQCVYIFILEFFFADPIQIDTGKILVPCAP